MRKLASLFLLICLMSAATVQGQEVRMPSETRLELVEFREIPLREAVRLLSELCGMNLAASIEARDVEVSLFLRDVTPRDALTTLTRTHGLFFREDEGTEIITIYTNDELQENLQSFRDEETRVFTMLYPNAVDAALALQSLYGTRVIVSFGDNGTLALQDLTQRFSRFDLIDGRSQGLGLFGGGGGFGGGGFGGGGIGGGGFGGGGLGGGLGGGGFGGGLGGGGFGGGIGGGGFGGGLGGGGFGGGLLQGANRGQINQANAGIAGQAIGGGQILNQDLNVDVSNMTPEQIQAVVDAQRGVANERQLRELQRLQQANIFVTVIQRQNQVIVRTSDPETMQQIAELIQKIDVPTPMVLLEVKIMEITLDDGFTSIFDYEFTDGDTASGGFTNGNILPPTADIFAGLAPGRTLPIVSPSGATIDATATPPTVDFTIPATPNGNALFQIVDANFRARVQMLENKNRVTTLASPMLMTANNEVSRLFVGNEVPLNRSFAGGATIGGAGGVAQGGANTTIEFRPVGTTLLITPSINADRTVTLRILQERSSIDEDGANVQIPDGSGGFTEQAIDTVNSRTYSGTVVAKDGMTLALGGLIDESVGDNRQAVPVLGKLPVIGVMFRDQMTGRRRTELVMMVRPYIFNTPSEATCTSEWLVDEHSLHPNAADGKGTLGTFSPHEVVRPTPPTTPLETMFRFHSVEPKEF
ncbi:MAG: hypothetical protein AAFU85_31550 [Planctomycetota bacterium]